MLPPATVASLARDGTIQDANGKHVATLKGDVVSTLGGATLATFSGDTELASLNRDKLLLDETGTLTLNDTAIGKVEAVANSKRAALVSVWYVLYPPPAKLQTPEPRPKPGGKPSKGGKKR